MDSKALSQLRPVDGQHELSAPGQVITAIFRVVSGYTPPQVTVRSRIDQELFTGSFPAHGLDALRNDKNVISVSPSQQLAKIS